MGFGQQRAARGGEVLLMLTCSMLLHKFGQFYSVLGSKVLPGEGRWGLGSKVLPGEGRFFTVNLFKILHYFEQF